jgi:pyruvate/2-oxoglutarate dehydrogenase complex dihydrolipoamide acyltransferase (E2) component
MLASWTEPSEGIVTMRVPVRTERVNEIIQSQKDKKLTLTHFALKAVSQLLVKQPDLNGKLALGKVIVELFSGYPMKLSTSAA